MSLLAFLVVVAVALVLYGVIRRRLDPLVGICVLVGVGVAWLILVRAGVDVTLSG